MTEIEIRQKIAALVAQFHQARAAKQAFIPGKTPVRYAGRFDEKEIQAAVEASLDFWLTEGRFTEEFQSELAARIGVGYAHPDQFRFFGQSSGRDRPDLPSPGRAASKAWR